MVLKLKRIKSIKLKKGGKGFLKRQSENKGVSCCSGLKNSRCQDSGLRTECVLFGLDRSQAGVGFYREIGQDRAEAGEKLYN